MLWVVPRGYLANIVFPGSDIARGEGGSWMVKKGLQLKHGDIGGSVRRTKEWRVSCGPAHHASSYIDEVEWSTLVAADQ